MAGYHYLATKKRKKVSWRYPLILLVAGALLIIAGEAWTQEGRPTAAGAKQKEAGAAAIRSGARGATPSDARESRATVNYDHPILESFDHPVQDEIEKQPLQKAPRDLQPPSTEKISSNREKNKFERKQKEGNIAGNKTTEQDNNHFSFNPRSQSNQPDQIGSSAYSNQGLIGGTSKNYPASLPGFSLNGAVGGQSGIRQGSQSYPTSGRKFSKSLQNMSFWDIYGALNDQPKAREKEKPKRKKTYNNNRPRLRDKDDPDL